MKLYNPIATYGAPPDAAPTTGERPLVATAPLASRQRRMEQMQTVITAHLYKNVTFPQAQKDIDRQRNPDCVVYYCIQVPMVLPPQADSKLHRIKGANLNTHSTHIQP